MKIELSDVQVKQLLNVIAQANIKGSEARAILELAQAIQTPAKEDKCNDKDKCEKPNK